MLWILVFLLIITLYFYTTKNQGYWKKKNVKHDPPLPLFGNHLRNVFGQRSIVEISVELYNKYPNEKVVGYYRGRTPELIIRDIDIAKNILSTDFTYFYPRGLGRDVELEPMLKSLFFLDGDMWKLLRQRITPAFTTAKLKGMFPLIVSCAKKLQVVGEDIIDNGGECDIRDLMARFTTEFIGAVGFGIEVDSINNENSRFREIGKLIFSRSYTNLILLCIYEIFPEFRKIISVRVKELDEAIVALVKTICEQRNYKPSERGDFIDLLLDLKSKGTIKGESIEKRNPDGSSVPVEMEMDFMCLAAQVLLFFAAGFETSSSATSFTLHQLAYHPEIQATVQKEIDEVLAKYNNELCYESIADMTLLSNAFNEGMRLFPSLGALHRVCARKYTIPELNITLDPGVKIIVPVQAIHTDEKYFADPLEFRPERFAGLNKNRYGFSFLPFGAGPRACIGERLGEMQSLAGLAAILNKFSVKPSQNTRRIPEVRHTSNVVQGVKHGLPLTLTLREKVL